MNNEETKVSFFVPQTSERATKRKSTKKYYYGMMFFVSKQVHLPIIPGKLNPAKIENQPTKQYTCTPFLQTNPQ